MAMHKVVGIDLGTTYSAVSVWDYDRKEVTVIPTAMGSVTLPSVVGLDPEGRVVVGAQAQNNLVVDPENTVIEVKRLMGTYERKPTGPEDPGIPQKVLFRGRQYLPQEISAFILMELKRQAEIYIGEPVHDAVITVPAYFEEPQKGATRDAGEMARFNVRMLLNEPTAAAVCFGADKVTDGQRHVYAVYDLGGGTFDVSIIEVKPDNVSVVGTGGNSRLGGGDFDDRITEWVLEQIRVRHGEDFSRDSKARARIKREAEQRKRDLAAASAAMIQVQYLSPTLSVNIPITRAIFEGLIEDLLQASLECLDAAIESAHKSNGIEREEIEQVLLVGGSTRIPKVREMLARHMGLEMKDIRCDFNPDEVVSRGAAIRAMEFTPYDAYQGKEIVVDMGEPSGALEQAVAAGKKQQLNDVTSHTLGILANQADFIPIIERDSKVPISVTKGGFVNAGPTQTLDVLIFQGENPVAFENTLIGKIPIQLPEPRERGFYHFEVTFSIDRNGLLNATVKCLNDGKTWPAEVQCNLRSSKEEIEASAKRLEQEMVGGIPAGADLPVPPRPAFAPPPPPPATPEQFKSAARRTYKLLTQMPPGSRRDRLWAAYSAFLQAVSSGAKDLEELGDALEETYIDCRA